MTGNARHDGGEEVTAVLHQRDGGRDVRLSVRDMHNGTYEIATVPSRAGEGDRLEICMGDQQVPGSPFLVRSVATTASVRETSLVHVPEHLTAVCPFLQISGTVGIQPQYFASFLSCSASLRCIVDILYLCAQARDGFGNDKTHGGEDVDFEVSSDSMRQSYPVINRTSPSLWRWSH